MCLVRSGQKELQMSEIQLRLNGVMREKDKEARGPFSSGGKQLESKMWW